jgi:hypothetical protein
MTVRLLCDVCRKWFITDVSKSSQLTCTACQQVTKKPVLLDCDKCGNAFSVLIAVRVSNEHRREYWCAHCVLENTPASRNAMTTREIFNLLLKATR